MLTSPRQRSFVVSGVVHAGLVGLLLLMASRTPLPTEVPIRMRLVEPPVPRVEPPPRVPSAPAPGAGRVPEGVRPKRAEPAPPPPAQTARPRLPERPAAPERVAPRGTPAPDTPRVAPLPVPQSVPPPVASRPAPAPAAPPAKLGGPPVELPRETARVAPSPPPRPERGGLTLGGPSAGATLPPPTAPGSGKRPAGRSIRDQLAGIGAGLGDDDTPGRETIRLDSQEPRYLDTLARIKRRIELVWGYPEEAMLAGIGGEVLLMFTMRKTGTLTGVRLLQGSGYPSLDQEALRAIKAAAPFDPFPPQTVEDPVNILASFHYNSPYRFRRN